MPLIYNNSKIWDLKFNKSDMNFGNHNGSQVYKRLKTLVAATNYGLMYSVDDGENWGMVTGLSSFKPDTVIYTPMKGFVAYRSGKNQSLSNEIYYSLNGIDHWNNLGWGGTLKKVTSGNKYAYQLQTDGFLSDISEHGSASISNGINDIFYDEYYDKHYAIKYSGTDDSICNIYELKDDNITFVTSVDNSGWEYNACIGICAGHVFFRVSDDSDDETKIFNLNTKTSETHSFYNLYNTVKLIKTPSTSYICLKEERDHYSDINYLYNSTISQLTNYDYWHEGAQVCEHYGCETAYIDGSFYSSEYNDLRKSSSFSSRGNSVLNLGSSSRYCYELKKANSNIIAPSNYGLWISSNGTNFRQTLSSGYNVYMVAYNK